MPGSRCLFLVPFVLGLASIRIESFQIIPDTRSCRLFSKRISLCSLAAQSESFSRAIVVGGSIAGLLSASVLSKHFDEVLILDRDDLTQNLPPAPRLGVPQSSTPHTLFVRGFDIIKELIPGIETTLADAGALEMDWTRHYKVYRRRFGHAVCSISPETVYRVLGRDLKSITCSRYLLETAIRESLRSSRPNINFEAGRVAGLLVSRPRTETRQSFPLQIRTSIQNDSTRNHSGWDPESWQLYQVRIGV